MSIHHSGLKGGEEVSDRARGQCAHEVARAGPDAEAEEQVKLIGGEVTVVPWRLVRRRRRRSRRAEERARVALTEAEMKASVPSGVPRTGWPAATEEPSPRRRAAER